MEKQSNRSDDDGGSGPTRRWHKAAMHAAELLEGQGAPNLASQLTEIAAILTPDQPLPVLKLTWAELERLPEYSGSVPTGTAEGKRWRRNRDVGGRAGYGAPSSRWMVGEYRAPEGEVVPITWYEVEVEGHPRTARTPAEDAIEAIGQALGSLHVINLRARSITRWYGQPGGESLNPAEEAAVIAEERLRAHRSLVGAFRLIREGQKGASNDAGRCSICGWSFAPTRS